MYSLGSNAISMATAKENQNFNANQNQDTDEWSMENGSACSRFLPSYSKYGGVRLYIFKIFDDPQSSILSLGFSILSGTMVLLSTIVLMISSMPRYRYPNYGDAENDTAAELQTLEFICTIFFTIEYLVRLFTASASSRRYITGRSDDPEDFSPREFFEVDDTNELFEDDNVDAYHPRNLRSMILVQVAKTKDFMIQPMNVIDLVAILPFYLESATGTSINLTSLRQEEEEEEEEE
eukprot:jgi/Bigna1/133879/aug1.23_g8587